MNAIGPNHICSKWIKTPDNNVCGTKYWDFILISSGELWLWKTSVYCPKWEKRMERWLHKQNGSHERRRIISLYSHHGNMSLGSSCGANRIEFTQMITSRSILLTIGVANGIIPSSASRKIVLFCYLILTILSALDIMSVLRLEDIINLPLHHKLCAWKRKNELPIFLFFFGFVSIVCYVKTLCFWI